MNIHNLPFIKILNWKFHVPILALMKWGILYKLFSTPSVCFTPPRSCLYSEVSSASPIVRLKKKRCHFIAHCGSFSQFLHFWTCYLHSSLLLEPYYAWLSNDSPLHCPSSLYLLQSSLERFIWLFCHIPTTWVSSRKECYDTLGIKLTLLFFLYSPPVSFWSITYQAFFLPHFLSNEEFSVLQPTD